MNIQNVIFDFDGVIVDSEPIHAEAKKGTLDHFQLTYDSDLFDQFKGIPDSDFFRFASKDLAGAMITAEAMNDYKRTLYAAMLPDIKLIEGVFDFIEKLKHEGIKIGIASSTTKSDFLLINDKYKLNTYFDVMVTGGDTSMHKPHPEPYLKAMEYLKALPEETAAIEDSPNGIKSALASGCTVIGLTTSFDQVVLKDAGAHFITDSFAKIDYLDLLLMR
ncbi:HAD-IA family hydrolase [Pedobacter petrophilus]|uniref:HAD-IA family hydrolase n=1 Tax=Pedobacter petrophilus TaxID=1908241 RepID=A0A7K0G4U4_9SPHI|nr:HAD family phosphatase [Pedobacter petrophilus]MRX78833.1 HAD-IA family hydrolase [Pedobacter petrophilus]